MWTVAQCPALELHERYLPFSYAFGRRVLDNCLVASVYLSTRLRYLLSVFVNYYDYSCAARHRAPSGACELMFSLWSPWTRL